MRLFGDPSKARPLQCKNVEIKLRKVVGRVCKKCAPKCLRTTWAKQCCLNATPECTGATPERTLEAQAPTRVQKYQKKHRVYINFLKSSLELYFESHEVRDGGGPLTASGGGEGRSVMTFSDAFRPVLFLLSLFGRRRPWGSLGSQAMCKQGQGCQALAFGMIMKLY